jgi:hypothetical protein
MIRYSAELLAASAFCPTPVTGAGGPGVSEPGPQLRDDVPHPSQDAAIVAGGRLQGGKAAGVGSILADPFDRVIGEYPRLPPRMPTRRHRTTRPTRPAGSGSV